MRKDWPVNLRFYMRADSDIVAWRKMSKNKLSLLAVLLLMQGCVFAEDRKPHALLPANSARDVLHFCSRSGLQRVDGAWQPTGAEIKLLESRLDGVSQLRSEGAPSGVQIGRPKLYFRQYIAVMVAGQKLIYVNAFSSISPPLDWRKRLVDICDSGPSEWGVLYNPKGGIFLDLQTNVGLVPPPPPPHL